MHHSEQTSPRGPWFAGLEGSIMNGFWSERITAPVPRYRVFNDPEEPLLPETVTASRETWHNLKDIMSMFEQRQTITRRMHIDTFMIDSNPEFVQHMMESAVRSLRHSAEEAGLIVFGAVDVTIEPGESEWSRYLTARATGIKAFEWRELYR